MTWSGSAAALPKPQPYHAFFSYRHSAGGGPAQTFWHSTRRTSAWRTNKASDVYITFVDLTGAKRTPDRDTVTVRLTCSNGELPGPPAVRQRRGRFPTGGRRADHAHRGTHQAHRRAAAALAARLLWRLISKLSLNYLSLVYEGVDAFREILRLHNFTGSLAAEKQIDGILSLRSEPHFARLSSPHGIAFARGTQVELELDEEQFAGTGAYTFASVMDVFLGLYISMNSFSQLVVRTRQRKGVLKQWPPRAGQRILL